jgi:hypothetical protein
MRALSASAFVLSCLVAPSVGASARAEGPGPNWEGRAIAALAAGDQKSLRSLAEEYRKLPPRDRAKLPVRIRDDAVEFAFRGEFPGDQSPWGMLEYLASGPGKDYEALLVVSAAEGKRVQALRAFFEKQPRKGRGQSWSARLAWVEDGKPESTCLTDLLAPLKVDERERFLDQVGVNSAGLGGDLNVAADPARLPRKRAPALLLLTIRLPRGGGPVTP